MRLVFVFLLYCNAAVFAQNATDQFTVEGEVEKPLTVDWALLKTFQTKSLDSLRIYNHEMQFRHVMKNIRGVLLKDVLNRVKLIEASPKKWSEFYLVCIAADGYKVVYSWNEVFNNPSGNKIVLVTEKDGAGAAAQPDRIAMISAADEATGRRYVKGLSKIVIERAK